MLALVLLSGSIAGAVLVYNQFPERLHFFPRRSQAAKIVVMNGSDQWVGVNKLTAMTSAPFLPPDTGTLEVSPLFASYYQRQQLARSLGDPITVAFPTTRGWVQFFSGGALLSPAPQPASIQYPANGFASLAYQSQLDPTTSIVRLPLLQELLSIGSLAPVGGSGSDLTYVDLRKATSPELMRPAPARNPALSTPNPGPSTMNNGVFIPCGKRGNQVVGHFIVQPFWNYLQRSDVAPNGWEDDFGLPLTEALAFTLTDHGTMHQMQVQLFAHAGLILDLSAGGQPVIRLLAHGVDYLRTLGPPPVVLSLWQTAWTLSATALLQTPGSGQVLAHVGLYFPLELSGQTNWTAGMLWYQVQWSSPQQSYAGWVAASALSFTSPGNQPAWASIDALSPDLLTYLTQIGSSQTGVVIYDMTRQRYYTYHGDSSFLTASSIKVPIMLAFFDQIEQQKREPDDQEMFQLTTMIENSDNDSASLLFSAINGSAGLSSFLRKVQVQGVAPQDGTWGYSTTTPRAIVDLLTLLYTGKILNHAHRALALDLMQHIEDDQRVGVGDTAPAGASVSMKDGWVTGPDDFWAVNSSGIVSFKDETYLISVYTQGLESIDDGMTIVRRVCRAVATLLVPK